MDRKVVGGKCSILVHYVDVCAPYLSGAVLALQPFQMRYFVVLFDQKSCYFCVPTTLAKQFFFCNHNNKKVVEGKHNVLVHYVEASAPTQKVLSIATRPYMGGRQILNCQEEVHKRGGLKLNNGL